MKVSPKKYAFALVALGFVYACSSDSSNEPTPPEPVACEGQISISASEISGSSASLSWTTTGNYSAYEVELGAGGFTQGQGTTTSFNTTSGELNNLDVNTEYDLYIRGRCGTDNSDWFGPVSFATLCDAGAFVGDVLLTTQAEVDAFTAQCYTSIEGDLTLKSDFNNPAGISDLRGFSGLSEVIGDLRINTNGLLTNLDGLEGLQRVVSLRFDKNSNLESIQGLRNLEEFIELPDEDFNARTLSINGQGIASLEGLEKIRSLQILSISTSSLTSLRGLDNLESVDGSVIISANDDLESLGGLEALQTVGEFVTVFLNESLTSLSGLDNLNSIGEALSIENNESLNSLDALSSLSDVERIEIENNPSLNSLAGINYSSIEFFLKIDNNDGLTNFNGLQFDTTTSAFLEVRNCDGISSMAGLEGLTDTFGLHIFDNSNLVSLDGLENLILCRNQISIRTNQILGDFCGLDNLFQNGQLLGDWQTQSNFYNPDVSQMQAGQCVR